MLKDAHVKRRFSKPFLLIVRVSSILYENSHVHNSWHKREEPSTRPISSLC